MQVRQNRVVERMRAGKYVLFFGNTPFITPKLVEMAGLIGFDGVWIDMEHQDYHYHDVSNMCLACRATGMEPMVRIRKSGDHAVYRAFEAGATGIMVPHVKSGQEAQWIARNSRFYPEGLRGMDGVEPAANFGLMKLPDYIAQANREIFVVAQIEDVEALDTLDDIAATPGIDILFLGAQDLSQSMGIPCQFDHPRIVQARKRVAEAARKYNKWWGCPAGVEKAEILYKEEGAQFFAGCAAIWFVLDGLKQVRAEFTKRLGD